MTKKLAMIVVLLIFATIAPGAQGKSQDKISPDLRNASGSVGVIVQYKNQPIAADFQKVGDMGGQVNGTLDIVKGAAFQIGSEKIATLAADANVAYVSPDRHVSGLLDYTAAAVGANVAFQSGYDGRGIGIAIIDSGLGKNQPDLTQIVYTENFTSSPHSWDEFGHGTHVAGIAAGSGAASTGWDYTRTFRGI